MTAIATIAWLACNATAIATETTLYPLNDAISIGVVNTRIDLFSHSDFDDVMKVIKSVNPGIIYKTYVPAWGVTRQQDIDAAGRIASNLREKLPRTILGAGLPESISISNPPNTLNCGDNIGQHTFDPNALIDTTSRQLGGTYWLDLAKNEAKLYYSCLGTMLIDRGYTLLDFEEHENTLAHSSDKQAAMNSLLVVMKFLRSYGRSKGVDVIFSGDPSRDATSGEINMVYVPSRFFHNDFAREYRNRIERPGIGGGYSYTLSVRRVKDVMASVSARTHVFFYVDNWDPKQDDLRRFMELDAENRRFLIESSARVASENRAYFIPNLLHCKGCVPADVIGDKCEIRSDGKTEYDAVACGDVDVIQKSLKVEREKSIGQK